MELQTLVLNTPSCIPCITNVAAQSPTDPGCIAFQSLVGYATAPFFYNGCLRGRKIQPQLYFTGSLAVAERTKSPSN